MLGIISATTGTICVILTGKDKLSAYVLGLMNVLLYADIAYRATLYGETMLNLLYYLPMQFVGWFSWKNTWIPIMEKC
ncbi:nicotinamide mononucleotide transporter PnuC [Fibrobacter intestinalis]|uniref:Nicotinamide riboside transporter PnuC n=1 Tax=Fibrobacter intestinalis TaxID=28122 RepID=A0A1M6SPR1_9BACT|nr:nicotinamide riboside transporter PnuC [Fibrobacter intestinalis]SHK46639.1 nicotinamide mononucleotide transporter PnuC [Fibrobacter intestinalis]